MGRPSAIPADVEDRIIDLSCDGLSASAISQLMEDEGVARPTARSKSWHRSHVLAAVRRVEVRRAASTLVRPHLRCGPMDSAAFVSIVLVAASAVSSAGVLVAIRAFTGRNTDDAVMATIDDQDVDEALQALRDRLTEGGSGSGTPAAPEVTPSPGELEARAILDVYAKELSAEAKRVAKRAKAERPSKEHVRQAADRIGILRDRAGVASDLALAIGSIFVGAAVSYQVNLWTGGLATNGFGWWMALALAVGVGAIVAAIAIKWRRV